MIAEVTKETELYNNPDTSSVSTGTLPPGTLLRLLGKRKEGFEKIEVELVDGIAEGWVERNALNLKDQEKALEKWDNREATQKNKQLKGSQEYVRKKIIIPRDELALIRREKSFFYGILLDIPYVFLKDTNDNLFVGLNYKIGMQGGFYLNNDWPFRMEFALSRVNGAAYGTSPVGEGQPLELMFTDVRGTVEYTGAGLFHFLGFLQASIGVSIGQVPQGVQIGSVISMSTFGAGAGVGYRFMLAEDQSFYLQSYYSIGFLGGPFTIQSLALRMMWSLEG